MKKVLFILSVFLFAACGDANIPDGEDHGNIAAGDLGVVLTQTEHPLGWGEADCFLCHMTDNIHRTDRTGTGVNLEAVRSLVEEQGLASCADCHGTNGL